MHPKRRAALVAGKAAVTAHRLQGQAAPVNPYRAGSSSAGSWDWGHQIANRLIDQLESPYA